ncbi:hypothetical protein Pan44_30820 [Caulifigura coniformis]|uniref:Uncharacterized protein n=1 Tax=Caulifigura coniformis TaxID=2527983 RepID=A0A517SFZ0_9PLAN|nr:hypothetical protein Pan44_30820 [Caulifigura coniformis]
MQGIEGSEPAIATPRPARVISGKTLVIGMFAFGLLLTGLLYAYWDLHTRPFRPLQDAIARVIPGSQPRVIGGRHKSHRIGAPKTLRIIVEVDYNPLDEANQARRDEAVRKILELARTQHDVSPYEKIEMHLEHRVPERPPVVWSLIQTPADWEAFSAREAVPGSSS